MNIALVLRAADFAARRHLGQVRKSSEPVPYISHPLNVARVLNEEGGVSDPELLAAAMLHDVLEDTAASRAEFIALRSELGLRFGERVAAIVEELTDDKSLPKAERKRLQVLHAARKSQGAALVKVADKLCNIRDIWRDPPRDWPATRRLDYIRHAEEVVSRLPLADETLRQVFVGEARLAMGAIDRSDLMGSDA